MVKRSPLMILAAEQIRHSLPTFLRGAMNVSKFVASKVAPRSNSARAVYHGFRNWYEGGWPLWTGGEFSYLPSLVQDARWDQNYVTRREMMRRMRYWSQNSPIIESILSVGERYTVGASGLHVSFYPTDDVEDAEDGLEDSWYERADAVIAEWFKDCGWNGETMAELLKIGFRDQKVDGEVFVLKTRKVGDLELKGRTLKVSKPALQLIEAHRVESPWNKFEQEDVTLIDGVQFQLVDVDGRQMLKKTGYWVRSGQSSFEQDDSWRLISMEDCWQLRNVHRADQPRSVSDFYAGEVTINKLEDLLEIEMKAAATQSMRAVGYKSASGAATSPLDRRLEAVSIARGQQAPTANTYDKEFAARRELFRKETGAYVYGIKDGEEIQFDSPVRPSESTLNLWEFLVNSICAATKAPRCLVFEKISGQSARTQGTEVRANLDSADSFFQSDFQKWKKFVSEAVVFFMEWAIKNDFRVADPPANWKSCIHIQQPEACNVDVGYTTQASLMMLAAGATDYDAILGPQGKSFVVVAKRLARQQKMIKKLGIEVTLPALLPGQIALNGTDDKAKEKVEV